jgi:hypothetical protein
MGEGKEGRRQFDSRGTLLIPITQSFLSGSSPTVGEVSLEPFSVDQIWLESFDLSEALGLSFKVATEAYVCYLSPLRLTW